MSIRAVVIDDRTKVRTVYVYSKDRKKRRVAHKFDATGMTKDEIRAETLKVNVIP